MKKIKYLFIVIDSQLPSFCYYSNTCNKHEIISSESLIDAFDYCSKNDVIPIVIINDDFPDGIKKILSKNKYVPIFSNIEMKNINSNGAYIIYLDNVFNEILPIQAKQSTIILKSSIKDTTKLGGFLINNILRCKRINIIFTDIDDCTFSDLYDYKETLNKLLPVFYKFLLKGNTISTNILDRITLDKMNNCNSGIEHYSICPDGKLYLCPGLYYDGNESIGTINEGVSIANKELLSIAKSPICKRCDSYQCKRCVYLNHKLTSQINIPSRKQCMISNFERNISGMLQKHLKLYGNNKIKPKFYDDLFDEIKLENITL